MEIAPVADTDITAPKKAADSTVPIRNKLVVAAGDKYRFIVPFIPYVALVTPLF
ncbi:hypothetical protein [Staphylococcus xylosus]|uniref:hypothetical protein n=1 Tax=Staphylococcus xylosus TaxID=1288 RepID=UPI0015C530EF|nr:hypothetical protein [Staphylococcus xylosus]NQD97228.1 hypothetical protein [Staphylococcus xylosus]